MSDDKDKIEAERACEDLILDFALHADVGDYEQLGELFAEDGEFIRGGDVFTGPAAITEAVDAQLQNSQTAPKNPGWRVRHICTNIRVRVLDSDNATGRTHYVIYRYKGEPVEGPAPVQGAALVGDYNDVFVRTPKGWRIKKREIFRAFYMPEA
jgi:hypothetical protein